MSAAELNPGGKRVPCPHCGVMIIEGARKCRGCRKWLTTPPRASMRFTRSLTLLLAAVVAFMAVVLSGSESPVGEAPPLTPMGSTDADEPRPPMPAGIGSVSSEPTPFPSPNHEWRSRTLRIDTQPLDLAFGRSGDTIYVISEDTTLREFDIRTGKLLHITKLPVRGDRIKLLHDRWLAVIRHTDAAHIPVIDTESWDSGARLLYVGMNPADIVALPDGKTAVTASSRGKRLSWFDLSSGRRLANIRLPHATSSLYLLEGAEGNAYVGAMGMLRRAGRPAGAWIDLFDPSETPFGATRRSISVGRDPRSGAVTSDRKKVFFADHVSNIASLLRVDATTKAQTTTVGHGPAVAFLMHNDRYGITLDTDARTTTVVELATMKRVSTLMLTGTPREGAVSADGSTLFVSLGGTTWPPRDSGAVIIADEPPKVVAAVDTGRGVTRVAASPAGLTAAVANYRDKTLTIIEQKQNK